MVVVSVRLVPGSVHRRPLSGSFKRTRGRSAAESKWVRRSRRELPREATSPSIVAEQPAKTRSGPSTSGRHSGLGARVRVELRALGHAGAQEQHLAAGEGDAGQQPSGPGHLRPRRTRGARDRTSRRSSTGSNPRPRRRPRAPLPKASASRCGVHVPQPMGPRTSRVRSPDRTAPRRPSSGPAESADGQDLPGGEQGQRELRPALEHVGCVRPGSQVTGSRTSTEGGLEDRGRPSGHEDLAVVKQHGRVSGAGPAQGFHRQPRVLGGQVALHRGDRLHRAGTGHPRRAPSHPRGGSRCAGAALRASSPRDSTRSPGDRSARSSPTESPARLRRPPPAPPPTRARCPLR